MEKVTDEAFKAFSFIPQKDVILRIADVTRKASRKCNKCGGFNYQCAISLEAQDMLKLSAVKGTINLITLPWIDWQNF